MARLTVAINAQLLYSGGSYRNAGVSRYIRNLLAWLPQVDPELRILAFVGPPFEPSQLGDRPPGLRLVPTRLPTQTPAVRILWEQLILPALLERCRPSVFHSPLNALPLLHRTPSVVTVHDLAFEFFPETYPALKALYLRASARQGTRRARRVLAVSRATANDLMAAYGLPRDKIVVVPNGVDPRFKPSPPEACNAFRARKGLGPYFLYLGTLQPRKNLGVLLQAWSLSKASRAGYMLVLAGPPGWHYRQLVQTARSLDVADRVVFLGWIPEEEAPILVASATAFLYPSLYEGFGLPVLEAMACGTPVIVSDAPALTEVAQDAGLVVPVKDTEAWAQALDRMAFDQDLRQGLSADGLEKARSYSWRHTAQLTAKAYREVAAL